ncbi:porin family protein [Hymenobacter guriensis]|uniref:Outer membrane protein beta-barrel domain-containing protein n=1 Tax=Hymenobacter guriensis TaxID=2793065 RepID=A0ABS0L6Z6_9BACT|nr:hypothetical protein [Hymenobacter guriensis]MBG8555923.1 hypothetical protein [Hymenobacter guriensis]
MTEQESEQFYNDLRHKLHDFGSPVPEAVWSGIQQQLPKPKNRRRWPVLLLLLIGSFVIYEGVVPSSMLRTGLAGPSGPEAVSVAKVGHARQADETSDLAGARAAGAPGVTAGSEAGQTAGSQTASHELASASLKSADGSGVAGNLAAVPTRKVRPTLLPLAGRTRKPVPGEETGEESDASRRSVASTSTRRKKAGLVALAATVNGRRSRTGSRPSRNSGTLDAATREASLGHSLAGSSNKAARRRAGRSGQLGWAAGAANSAAAGKRREATGKTKPVKISYEPIALRHMQAPDLTPEEPEVHKKRRPRVKRSRKDIILRGFGVELLGGSGISYRTLGGSPTQLEKLERPGTSFSGRVGVTYALNRLLTASAGVGYSEYATSLDYMLRKTSQETATRVSFRDVHRYFIIPVQARYRLAGNHRWSVGSMGGATVALRTGSRTTEGSACACTQQEWAPGVSSPYRSSSLLLTAGAFANYQTALGQWLSVRPQAQYFLTSITNPAQSKAPRRPWNLGVEVGMSWELNPRKK